VLSAVDTKVGQHIFEHAIRQFLCNKTVVLVTHQVHHLAGANFVMALNRNGSRLGCGSLSELLAQHPGLLELAGLHATNEEPNDKVIDPLTDTELKTRGAEDPASDITAAGDLSKEEGRYSGQVTSQTYKDYFKAMGSFPFRVLFIVILFVPQMAMIGVDVYLARWVWP
jgi:ATP-binding cassette subfamily C (CFTR/MRP) protein 4